MNSQFISAPSARFAQRIQKECADDRAAQVARAWQLAFSRTPTKQESTEALEFLSRQVSQLKTAVDKEATETKAEKKDEKKTEKKDEKTKPVTKPAPELQAPTELCQALLSANEFLYVD